MNTTSTFILNRKWPAAVLVGGLLALANGAVSQGNITVSVTANGKVDPTAFTYTGSGTYYSFGSGSYNGVTWNNLAVGQLATGSLDELSVGATGVTNTATLGGMVNFAAVDNNSVLAVNSLAAALQTASSGTLNGGVTGDGAGFLGGVSELTGTAPAVSQSQSQTFTSPPYSQAFSQTLANANIRSADITGAMSIYAQAGSNFDTLSLLENISTTANVFPGPVTTPEPATLALMAVMGTGLLLVGRKRKV
jgi:hypothetical protein